MLGNVHALGSAPPGVPAEHGVDGDTICPEPPPVHVDDLVVCVKPPRLPLVSDDERACGQRRGVLRARIFSCILQLSSPAVFAPGGWYPLGVPLLTPVAKRAGRDRECGKMGNSVDSVSKIGGRPRPERGSFFRE